jgi:phenylalanyl-tRNA synthetase beta chain
VFPSMSRDMALVVQQSVSHEDIMAIIRQNAGPELEKIELFDIFEGDAIGAGKKSMAYSVTYRSSARTLTDEEANVYHERVKDAIRSSLDVVIREGA